MKYIVIALVSLTLGFILSIVLLEPYFESKKQISLALNQAQQSHRYIKRFNVQPSEFKHFVMLDLERSLSYLLLMRDRSTDSMKKQICTQLIGIAKDKNLLTSFAIQADNSEEYIARLETFIKEIERCKLGHGTG